MPKTTISFVILSVVALFGAPVVTPQSPARVTLSKLCESAWIHTSYGMFNGTPVPANGLVVRAADGSVVLVDTAWNDDDTKQLLTLVERQTGSRVKLAFITHAHDDRIGGIRALLAAGIRVVSGASTRDLAIKQGLPAPEAATRNPQTFNVAGTSIELFYPGAGHTRDNTVVWFPDTKVLFGGCLIKEMSSTTKGNIADADVAAWPETMRTVIRRYPRPLYVVPGHGQYGGRELLEHTLEVVSR